ncbi:hypothetical protein AB0G87_20920 [Streptomyces asoensis]|uniref:hypothetical protein n=1 Tax=Streptomyces asoensis TaxID=249586 RepID=UPI0033DFF906
MGFSGHVVFARGERPLLDAPVFDALGAEEKRAVHAWPPRPGGWQTLQFHQGVWEDSHLGGLVEWTGAPVCAADVSDSSVGLVTGVDTGGRRWQAWLNLDSAAALLVEEPEDVDDTSLWAVSDEFAAALSRKRAELDAEVPADAEGARAWAAAAGVPDTDTAEQSRIEELLRSHDTFVEDLFDLLLDELGFPRAQAHDEDEDDDEDRTQD